MEAKEEKNQASFHRIFYVFCTHPNIFQGSKSLFFIQITLDCGCLRIKEYPQVDR